MAFTLPELDFAYDALEPYMDEETMKIHHGKHHQTYVNNANAAMEGLDDFAGLSPEEVISRINEIPADKQMPVRNNVGGHANHSFFWKCLKQGTELKGALKEAIERDFGSVDSFKEQFEKAATGRFGSGWAWLILDEGVLKIASTPNQDSPLMGEAVAGCKGKPLLVIDVWEHAYYLKYQNRRPEFAKEFWNIVNWDAVAERFEG